MIYRCKAISSGQLEKFLTSFRHTYDALMQPSGAALFQSQGAKGETLVVLTQHYSELFERLSPGLWESLYNPDTSTFRFVAGDCELNSVV